MPTFKRSSKKQNQVLRQLEVLPKMPLTLRLKPAVKPTALNQRIGAMWLTMLGEQRMMLSQQHRKLNRQPNKLAPASTTKTVISHMRGVMWERNASFRKKSPKFND